MKDSSGSGRSKPKRQDLQGIRGIAIIAVLGFHFYPSTFPNGYLGVDQFFVLSGFLMCMLLSRSESLPLLSLITLFYSKRFKRILPLYLLIISLSILFLYFSFPVEWIEINQNSATRALLFVSNRPNTEEENYFLKLSNGVDLFTHTWSLSVEIQFYFLVPLIFIIGSRFSSNLQYLYYASIGLISFLFYSLSSQNVSFNSVFARIWQFIVGMIVFLFSNLSKNKYDRLSNGGDEEEALESLVNQNKDGEEETSEKKRVDQNPMFSSTVWNYCLILSMVYLVAYPIAIPVWFMRPYFTIATGILMCISIDDKILSNRILAYIGDISYSLYLVHWPIYSYWKSTIDHNQSALFCCLIGSIILSIVIFETYEKWYLKLSSTTLGFVVILLFATNVFLIQKDNIQEQFGASQNISRLDGVTENMTIDDAIKLNNFWIKNDQVQLQVSTCKYENGNDKFGLCNHTGLNPKSKYKIMLLGNSWTANHAALFYQECHHKANTMKQEAYASCGMLYPCSWFEICKTVFEEAPVRMAAFKPDYAFIWARFLEIGENPFPKNMTDIKEDPTYQTMINQTRLFVKSVKYKLYILDAVPRINIDYVKNIAPDIKKGISFDKVDKNLLDADEEPYKRARLRYAKLFEECGDKCVRIDYTPEFLNPSTKKFRYFDDKGFSYLTYGMHLSPHGLERVRHIYTDICKKL